MEEDEEEALRETPELMNQNDHGLFVLSSLVGRWWTLETSGCVPSFLQAIFLMTCSSVNYLFMYTYFKRNTQLKTNFYHVNVQTIILSHLILSYLILPWQQYFLFASLVNTLDEHCTSTILCMSLPTERI